MRFAIPLFVLTSLLMESNGMSSCLIELLLGLFVRVLGGLGLITIIVTAFFSGVSGSKLADIAAVALGSRKRQPNSGDKHGELCRCIS